MMLMFLPILLINGWGVARGTVVGCGSTDFERIMEPRGLSFVFRWCRSDTIAWGKGHFPGHLSDALLAKTIFSNQL